MILTYSVEGWGGVRGGIGVEGLMRSATEGTMMYWVNDCVLAKQSTESYLHRRVE